ncbi:MAG: winged helix-turn-helix transcriptional regulator [Candidatus Nanoarchaeia archaeon]|nr:winged helix-turn-helix transcriptional regulator [Candidatus Nanoarchaeia archaeon]
MEKTREKILSAIKDNLSITTEELAERCSLTLKGIEWQISGLKQEGIIKRIGPDKGTGKSLNKRVTALENNPPDSFRFNNNKKACP